MRRPSLAWLLLVGASVACRPPPPPPPPPVAATPPAQDAGPSDEELFARSMALLAESKRRAEEEDAAARVAQASPRIAPSSPDAGGASAAVPLAEAVTAPASERADLVALAAILERDDLAGSVERVHALFRSRSASAVPALELVVRAAVKSARAGELGKVEPVLARLQELPTSEPAVRTPLARLLGAVAVASARAAQPERSRQEARAALALDERTPDAYLALGEYQFQDNDLAGALDTWERGLRLNPGDPALSRRLERGRSEAQKVGGLERVASEHFVVAFDGRADVPAARATLEVMEAAYRSVGALFQNYPEGPIPLVVYPERGFEQEGHVGWTAGVYDGKIRLPAAGADAHLLRFRGLLFHEYAHALVHRSTGTRSVPSWLNEGFAEVARLRADPGPAVRCTPDAHAYPLRTLEGSFQRISTHRGAFLAYLEARHAVEHVLDRHGEAGVRALLAELATGASFDRAFERALGEDYARFAESFDAEARP